MHSLGDFAMLAVRCLGLLLIPTKVKRAEGDIPYLVKFVQVRY